MGAETVDYSLRPVTHDPGSPRFTHLMFGYTRAAWLLHPATTGRSALVSKCIFPAVIALVLLIAPQAVSARIYLRSGTISPKDEPAVSVAQVGRTTGSGYYLVQIAGPVTDDDKRSLARAGGEIVEYVPDNAFVVKLEHKALAQVQKLQRVSWVGPFGADYKLAPGIAKDSRQRQYVVELFPGQSAGLVKSKARLLGARSLACGEGPRRTRCRIVADGARVAALAESEGVAWIEPYLQPRLCNDAASVISGIPEVRQGLGLYGAGQVVGVADAGLDTGDLATLSADFFGRVVQTYGIRRPGEWSDLNGHGSHVVGSLIGAGVLSGSNPATRSYSGSFAGYAPEAHLVFQSIGDDGSYVFPPLHLAELFQPAYDGGVRVHSDSWGSAAAGQYTVYSNEVDQFCWDHKDFVISFAVGNEAEDLNQDGIIDSDNIYAPATAKNCIAVGATESYRTTGGYQLGYGLLWPSSFPVSPIKYDLISNNPGGMAAFSGRGPVDDGRIKPDLCAPGTNIISCRTHAVTTAYGWASYNSDYCYWGGTSMSTPQVSGAAALVREFYQREKGGNPSAALVKAALIAGAVDISPGQYGTGPQREVAPAPDKSQGWGRLNLKRSLYPDPPAVNDFTDESAGLTTGEYREYQYTITSSTVPFVATLVWTDYPGAVHAAKELVNDLDLTVTTPSGTTYPLITSADHTNNVEKVTIASPATGVYKVRVTGYNVPMGPQDYALVVSGAMPATYVSGTVTSASGAPVQGATVSLTSGSVKYLTTNASGKFFSHVAPALYIVGVTKSGWTFAPLTRVVQVTTSPVEHLDFTGQGSPGSLSGTLTSAIGGIVSEVVESPHPYLNSMQQVYIITAHEQATRIRVHFAEIDLMRDGDTVYVLDAGDHVKNTFTGRGEDIWSSWIDGPTAKVLLSTNDYGNIGYGFYIDGYETDVTPLGPLSGVTVTLNPGGYQTLTGSSGGYYFSSIPPGTYTVTPSKPHWKLQPDSKAVEIPAGGTASGIDFQAFPPGSISGEVRASTSETVNVNIESPHPYPNNYENTWQINADPSTARLRLHFLRISTEPAFDLIYVMNGADEIVEIYTAEETDLWTPWIDGSAARITLSTDEGTTAYGFVCDKYEAEVVGAPLAGVRVDLAPDDRSVYSGPDGRFTIPDVDVGSHSVTPVLLPWTFDPAVVQVSISPAVDRSLFFYASPGVADVSSAAAAKLLPDGSAVTLSGAVVSAVFSGFFYVQSPDRASGIRVGSSASVAEGDLVTVSGTMATVNGERRIDADSVTKQ